MKRTAALALFSGGIALYCLLPFLWFVLTSLKSPARNSPLFRRSYCRHFIGASITRHWSNYGLLHYIANSVIVAGRRR